ncbi:hypothetical protein AB1285_23190 [Microbacterium sp. NRRL B-14842]|uniref:hypothetical protein n=1 Tax=Microbacterium sp. NRRL B-14842 TaxID=3162881 RepID=UPI003D2A01D3
MFAGVGRRARYRPRDPLNQAAAYELLEQDPYARARFHVRFRVPQGWNHVGLLGVKHLDVREGWFLSEPPGAVHDTWADGSEIHVALKHGWEIRPHEAVVFRKAKPLDTFTERMTRARERVQLQDEMHPDLRRAVLAALRNIMLHSIGAFAAAGRDETRVAASPDDVPPELQGQDAATGQPLDLSHPVAPERPHPKLLPPGARRPGLGSRTRSRPPRPQLPRRLHSGALTVDPSTLIGIQGDAIYTTKLPAWSLPDRFIGGGDDGKTGRLRLQGYLNGSFITPETLRQRDALKARAERAGIAKALEQAEEKG